MLRDTTTSASEGRDGGRRTYSGHAQGYPQISSYTLKRPGTSDNSGEPDEQQDNLGVHLDMAQNYVRMKDGDPRLSGMQLVNTPWKIERQMQPTLNRDLRTDCTLSTQNWSMGKGKMTVHKDGMALGSVNVEVLGNVSARLQPDEETAERLSQAMADQVSTRSDGHRIVPRPGAPQFF